MVRLEEIREEPSGGDSSVALKMESIMEPVVEEVSGPRGSSGL